MEELLRILNEIKPRVDFMKETALIDDGVLDSFDIISIVSSLNEAYSIEIEVADLEPDNFNTVAAILDLVNSLK